MERITHIVWDWNGTLVDDVDAAVNALNRLLAKRRLPTVSRTFYRAHFGFPVRDFYVMLGIDPARDWDGICRDFHDFIGEEPLRPAADARDALTAARRAGFRQTILSALREDILRTDVARLGFDGFFDTLAGTDNLDGASKLDRGRALFAAGGWDPAETVFVGDTLHDAEVARALGGACLLVASGHQTAERLAASGCPVVASPLAAVRRLTRTALS